MRRKGILNGPLLIIAVAAAVLVGFCSACDTTEPLPGSEAEISVTGYASGAEYLDGDTVSFDDRVLVVAGEVTDTDPLNTPDEWDGHVLVLRNKTEEYILSDFELQPVEEEESRWSFEHLVRIPSGFNTLEIHVSAFPGGTLLEASPELELNGAWSPTRENIVAAVEWNTVDRANLNLHLLDDLGNDCSENDPNVGGMRLDIGDSYGYGPEYITAITDRDATYAVEVEYADANGCDSPVPCTVHLYKNGAEITQSPYHHTFYPEDEGKDAWQVTEIGYP